MCPCIDDNTPPYAQYCLAKGCFMIGDFNTPCYTGLHLLLALGFGLPGLVLWVIGIPLGSFLFLRAHKREFDEFEFSLRFGFIYDDYRRKSYYWESIIFLRKLALVMITVFAASVDALLQLLGVLFVAVLALAVQIIFKPYQLKRMNFLEMATLIAICITFYAFCILQINTLNNAAQIAIAVLVLIVNFGVILLLVLAAAAEFKDSVFKMFDEDHDGQVNRADVQKYLRENLWGWLAWMSKPLSYVIIPWEGNTRNKVVPGRHELEEDPVLGGAKQHDPEVQWTEEARDDPGEGPRGPDAQRFLTAPSMARGVSLRADGSLRRIGASGRYGDFAASGRQLQSGRFQGASPFGAVSQRLPRTSTLARAETAQRGANGRGGPAEEDGGV